MAKTKSVAVQMKEILDEYSKRVDDAASDAAVKVGKESAQRIKNTSPKKTGSYARGWTIKRERGNGRIESVIVHNRTDYQLTHLLENGHIIRNKKGTYGRTNGTKHIAPVEQWGVNEFPNEVERQLQ